MLCVCRQGQRLLRFDVPVVVRGRLSLPKDTAQQFASLTLGPGARVDGDSDIAVSIMAVKEATPMEKFTGTVTISTMLDVQVGAWL
jgi:hypothetical protein